MRITTLLLLLAASVRLAAQPAAKVLNVNAVREVETAEPATVMAMFNIEMIGSPSKWGTNSAFITGYERTDMGKILEKNLAGSQFKFYPPG
jgi:hypothetical protein